MAIFSAPHQLLVRVCAQSLLERPQESLRDAESDSEASDYCCDNEITPMHLI